MVAASILIVHACWPAIGYLIPPWAIVLVIAIWAASCGDFLIAPREWTADIYATLTMFFAWTPLVFFGSGYFAGRPTMVVMYLVLNSLIGVAMCTYYLQYAVSEPTIRFLFWIALTALLIGTLQTLFGLAANPEASRLLAAARSTNEASQAEGIGGFGFIYMLPFTALVSTLYSLERKLRLRARTLALAALALTLSAITSSNYTIAFALTISAVLVLMVARRPGVLVLMLSTAAITFIMFSRDLGAFLSRIATDDLLPPIISAKLFDFGQSLQFGLDGMTAGRLGLYEDSWNSFTDQPLFGLEGGGYLSDHSIGGHSSWLDFLGAFGLWVGVPLMLTIVFAFRKSWRLLRHPKHRAILVLSTLMFTVLGTLNPVLTNPQVGFGYFFLVPLALAMHSQCVAAESGKSEGSPDHNIAPKVV